MADNVTADAGSGGAVFATDDIGPGVHYPISKLAFGALDTANLVTSTTTNPFPVALSDTDNAVLDTIDAVLDTLNAKFVTGTDIGDVDVLSVIPGTGATNLGKAIDSIVGATDTGVAMLAKYVQDTSHVSVDAGDYDVPNMSEFGALYVEPEQHHVIDDCDNLAGFGGTWAGLGNDTTGVALISGHVLGTGSIEFDKVNGAANTVFGGMSKTLTSLNLGSPSSHDIISCISYVSATTNISYFFLRLGDDAANYNEWRVDGADLTGGIWENIALEIGDASVAGETGTGVVWSAITYIAIGYAFNAETDTLANIRVDEISFHTNQHVNASLNSEVTTSVNSANINIQKVGNKVVNTEAGAVGTGTQRITLASDDPAVTSLQLLDNAISGAGFNITQLGGVAVSLNTGVRDTGTQRVTIATNDSVPVTGTFWQATQPVSGTVTANPASGTIDTVTNLAQMGGVALNMNTGVRATGTQRVTIATDDVVPVTNAGLTELAAAINTSRLDINLDSTPAANLVTLAAAVSTEMQCDIVGALPAGTNTIGGVTAVAAATGGMSYTMLALAAEDNDVVIKASAATVYFISVQSLDATPVYLKLFNLASFTPGTSAATLQFMCPAAATAANGAGIVFNFGPTGIQFGTGLCALIATGVALDNNAAVSANEVIVTIGWE